MTTLKPRTSSVVIYQGDDLERIAELRRAADIAERQQQTEAARVGDEGDAQAAKDEHDAFVEEAIERAVIVHLQHLPRKKFRELLRAHPPREDDEVDAMYGVNFDDFAEAFLPLSIASVEPETPPDRQAFLDDLPEGDYNRIFSTAYFLNRGAGSDPREGRFSNAPRSSAAI